MTADDLDPVMAGVRVQALEALGDVLLAVKEASAGDKHSAALITEAMAAFAFGSACAAAFNDSMARGVPTSPLQEAERLASECLAVLRKKFGN